MSQVTYVSIDGVGSGQPASSDSLEQSLRCERLDGWITSPEYVGDADTPRFVGAARLSDALRWSGEWWGTFRSPEGDVAIVSDYFGLCEVFYSVVSGDDGRRIVLASDTFRGILAARRAHGAVNALREDILLPTLTSHHNQFATRWSHETLADEVQVLPQGAYLLCSPRGVAVVPRRPRAWDSPAQALTAAVDAGVEIVRRAVDSGLPAHISLSGGKDSRAVLSLLLAAGVQDRVSVLTNSGASMTAGASKEILDRDAELAAVMVTRYGLRWLDGATQEWRPIGRRAHLENWQTHRSGSSFEIKDGTGVLVSEPSIDFQGMGGELTRSYLGSTFKKNYPGWWNAAGKTSATVRDDAATLFPIVCRAELIDPVLHQRARDAFVDSLDLGADGDVLDQIDASYRHYRNRAHTGASAFRRATGVSLVYPLATPELYEFAALNGTEERDDPGASRALFEVIEATVPDLNVLEFMSPPWPADYRSRGDAASWEGVDASAAIADRAGAVARRRIVSRENVEPEFTFAGRLRDNAALLEEAGVSEGVLLRTAHLAHRNARLRDVLVGATESARDVLTGPAATGAVRRFSLTAGRPAVEVREPGVFAREFALRDVSGVTATVVVEDEAIVVSAASVPPDVELACYLFIDGAKVDTQWYQAEPHFRFVRPDEGALVRASVFLRWRGLGEAARVVDVSTPLSASTR